MQNTFKYLCGTLLAMLFFSKVSVTEAHVLSNADEWLIGNEFIKKYESKYETYNSTKLNKIKENLIKFNKFQNDHSQRKLQSINMTSEDTLNAFEIPGGWIYVSEQMMDFTEGGDDNSILAFVVAHEVSHHINEDYLRKYDKKYNTNFFFSLLGSQLKGYDVIYANAAQELITTLNSRQMNFRTEQQADETGFKLLLNTPGYSPGGGAVFFSRLISYEKEVGSKEDSFVYPHSKSEVRLKRVVEEINKISNGRVVIKDNKLWLDDKLITKTGVIKPLPSENLTALEKTYLIAGNIAKAIYRGEWFDGNVLAYVNEEKQEIEVKAGNVAIGKVNMILEWNELSDCFKDSFNNSNKVKN